MITQQKLKELVHYNPETGVIKWLPNKSRKTVDGALAGSLVTTGARRLAINGGCYLDAQLAILYMTGILPKFIGRKNKKHDDNRFENIYGSDKRILIKLDSREESRKTVSKNEPIKKRIMYFLEGNNLNQGQLRQVISIDVDTLKIALKDLIRDRFIDRNQHEKKYRVTAKGHAEIMKSGDFERKEDLSMIWQMALTGKLSAGSSKPYFC